MYRIEIELSAAQIELLGLTSFVSSSLENLGYEKNVVVHRITVEEADA